MNYDIIISRVRYSKETFISTKVRINKYEGTYLYRVRDGHLTREGKFSSYRELLDRTDLSDVVFTYDLPIEMTILLNETDINITDFDTHRTFWTKARIITEDGHVLNLYDIFGLTLVPLHRFLGYSAPYPSGIKKVVEIVSRTMDRYSLPFAPSAHEIARQIVYDAGLNPVKINRHQVRMDTYTPHEQGIFVRSGVDENILNDLQKFSYFLDDEKVTRVKNIHLIDVKSCSVRILERISSTPDNLLKFVREMKRGFKTYSGFYGLAKFLGIYYLNIPIEYTTKTEDMRELLSRPLRNGEEVFLEYIPGLETISIVPHGKIIVKENTKYNPYWECGVEKYREIIEQGYDDMNRVGDVVARFGDSFLVTNLRNNVPREYGFEVEDADIATVMKYSFNLYKEANVSFRKSFVCIPGFISRNYVKLGKKFYEVLPSYYNFCDTMYILRKRCYEEDKILV